MKEVCMGYPGNFHGCRGLETALHAKDTITQAIERLKWQDMLV
jgi:hypothetical protein